MIINLNIAPLRNGNRVRQTPKAVEQPTRPKAQVLLLAALNLLPPLLDWLVGESNRSHLENRSLKA